MRNLIIFVFSCLLANTSANPQAYVGQCVFPKHTVSAEGNLQFMHAIPVFPKAQPADSSQLLVEFNPFRVTDVDNGLIELSRVSTSDGDNAHAGETLGWASPADFEEEDVRNCGL